LSENDYNKSLCEYRISCAEESYDVAMTLLREEHLKDANNRAYYSIFYSVCAVLALDGTAFKRHKDTLAYFNKEYVHTGKFPGEIGRSVAEAERIRNQSDYDDFYIAKRSDTVKQCETAGKLLDLVKVYAKEKYNK